MIRLLWHRLLCRKQLHDNFPRKTGFCLWCGEWVRADGTVRR